jgi:hypothetical protein
MGLVRFYEFWRQSRDGVDAQPLRVAAGWALV